MRSIGLMMGDDLFLAPEITMHEEPGEITINPGGVSVTNDGPSDFPFANGGLSSEISITKVTGSSKAQLTNNGGHSQPRHAPPPASQAWPGQQRHQRPVQVRPPPLIRGGALPPMPRLKFGGPARHPMPPHPPRQQQQHHSLHGPPPPGAGNPLVGMMNMMPRPGQLSNRTPLPPPHMQSPHMGMMPPQHRGGFRPVMRGGGGGGLRPPPMNPAFARQRALLRGTAPSFPRSSFPSQPPKSSPTVLQVPSPAFTQVAASTQNFPRGSFPPPMIRPKGPRSLLRHPPPPRSAMRGPHVRTVFVPPPMMNGRQQQVHHQMQQQQQQHQQQQQQDEIDDDEDIVLDEDELDDVEPDVDPNTYEVDDVEPGDAGFNSVTIGNGEDSATITPIPLRVPKRTGSEVRYVRSADGKIHKKIIDHDTINRLRAVRKKKKKKAFRGGNYRFDGSAIKKRVGGKRPPSAASLDRDEEPRRNGGNGPSSDSRDPPDVLAYLGIQRKDSTESKSETMSDGGSMVTVSLTSGPKAKKSFKAPFDLPDSITISRNSSTDDASSVDSSGALKRRLSLSEVLSNQKKLKSSNGRQVVRHSLGGGGGGGGAGGGGGGGGGGQIAHRVKQADFPVEKAVNNPIPKLSDVAAEGIDEALVSEFRMVNQT